MIHLKLARRAIATASILAFATAASATSSSHSRTSAINGAGNQGVISLSGRQSDGPNRANLLGSSSTASFYYRKGVRQFERGDYDKAERAFEAVLRANGSAAMDRLTLHYLTLVSQKQGDAEKARDFAEAYFAQLQN